MPHAGVYAFNSCKYADANSLTLKPSGAYRFGWAAGTWKRAGDVIVIVINWAIHDKYKDKVRSGRKAGVLRYRLIRLKGGRLALRSVEGGELMYRCKTAA